MNTSSEAINTLRQAQTQAQTAVNIIKNLIAEHDYQDVADLVAQSAVAMLDAALFFMQSQDEEAFGALEYADELVNQVYDIIDSEIDDE